MKIKSAITTAILLLSFTATFAQISTEGDSEGESAKFFIKAFTSYGFLTRGSFTVPANTAAQNATNATFSAQKKGMGAGVRYGFGIGLYLNKRLNLGVDAELLNGSNLTSTRNDLVVGQKYVQENQVADTTTFYSNSTLKHRMLSIIPHITFKAITTAKYYIYTRVGIIVGIPLKITQTDSVNSSHSNKIPDGPLDEVYDKVSYYNSTTRSTSAKYKSNPGFGYQAALGIQYTVVAKHLAVYFEVASNNLILKPAELAQTENTEVTTQKYYNSAGTQSIDHSLNIRQFKKEGTYTTSSSGTFPNQTFYTSSPQINMAVNSLNVGAGVVYRF